MDNNNFTNPFSSENGGNPGAADGNIFAPGNTASDGDSIFASAPSFGDSPADGSTAAASGDPANATPAADATGDPANSAPETATTGNSANAGPASGPSPFSADTSGFSEYRYSGSQMGGAGRETPFAGTSGGAQGGFTQSPYGAGTFNGNPYGAGGTPGQPPFGAQGGFSQNPYGAGAPGYGPYGAQGQSPYGGFGGAAPSPDKKKKKSPKNPSKRRGISGGTIALICALCLVLSAGAGFGSAWVYHEYFTEPASVVNTGNNVVIATTPEKPEGDSTTSTGVDGVYTDVVATVKDAVVEITTEFQEMGFFQYVTEGAGSGVIISTDGYVITNNHVISDTDSGEIADSITVRLTDGKEYDAVLVGRDADSDVAVIKIEAEEALTAAVFGDSDSLAVGEEVIAVGNPLGELGGTVTNGIISALDREISVDGTTMNLLQTNAAINPGNSGGGLFNMNGELIGVVNAKSSGSGIEGLGFAIPSNDALEVATQLMEHGYVTGKTYLGVAFYDVTDPYTAYRYFGTQSTGVYVVNLSEGYNDDVLEYGDRIVDVNGNEIYESAQIMELLKECEVGDTLEVNLYRKGKLTQVTLTCYEYVPDDIPGVSFDN